jgi:hypothetical protein
LGNAGNNNEKLNKAGEPGDDKVFELELLPCFGESPKISVGEQLLAQRVEALEERLEQMKMSRRVLMRILERAEEERRVEVGNLQLENQRLRRQNQALTHSLWGMRCGQGKR